MMEDGDGGWKWREGEWLRDKWRGIGNIMEWPMGGVLNKYMKEGV